MSESAVTLRCTTVLLSLLSLLSFFPFTYTLPTDVYLTLSLSSSHPDGLPKSNNHAILDKGECTEPGYFPTEDCAVFLRCYEIEEGELQESPFDCYSGTVLVRNHLDEQHLCVKPWNLNPDDPCYAPYPDIASKNTPTPLESVDDMGKKEAQAPVGRHGVKAKNLECTAKSIFRTNDNEECTEVGFFRNEDDCTKYYKCLDSEDGRPLSKETFDCRPGTVFDPVEVTCDYAWDLDPNEKCYWSPPFLNMASKMTPLASVGDAGKKEVQASLEKHEVKAKDLECTANGISRTDECTETGFFRYEWDCTKFYQCVDSGYVSMDINAELPFRDQVQALQKQYQQRDRYRNGQGLVKYDFGCGPGTVFDLRPSMTTCNHAWTLDPADPCYAPLPSPNMASKMAP